MYRWSQGVVDRSGKRTTAGALMSALMNWITSEMKSHMRATAPVSTGGLPTRPKVNQLSGDIEDDPKNRNKCYLCKNSRHWPAQCQTFAAMTIDEWLKSEKENPLHVFQLFKKSIITKQTAVGESSAFKKKTESSLVSTIILYSTSPIRWVLFLRQ